MKFAIDDHLLEFEAEFFVLPTLSYNGVLGVNFLLKENCQIDFSGEKI